MRIWSIHPKYLDAKGIVALWRETLLAKNVLKGNTKGYKHHPQLIRFKSCEYPVSAIDQYLLSVYHEALERGYKFNKSKIDPVPVDQSILVTTGQVEFEKEHLLNKLKKREPERYKKHAGLKAPEVHPMFRIVEGTVEAWEKL